MNFPHLCQKLYSLRTPASCKGQVVMIQDVLLHFRSGGVTRRFGTVVGGGGGSVRVRPMSASRSSLCFGEQDASVGNLRGRRSYHQSKVFISMGTRWSCVDKISRQGAYTSSVRLSHTSGGDGGDQIEKRELILPPLMQFPMIVWPKLINAIRNWFFITFIIKPYFDKEFSMNDFIMGAKEAISVVSNKLSEGKVDDLEGLVDASALAQIKQSISNFTVFQQQLLSVATEDIFFAFPYQIGIIIPDEPDRDEYPEGVKPPPQTRHVEITVCMHVLRGLAEQQKKGETGTPFNFQEFTKDERNKYNVMICNYRFFKDFTEGTPDPSWIVNMVNHFLPAEVNRQ